MTENIHIYSARAMALIRELAGPRMAGDPVKQCVGRVSRLTGLPYSRCYEIWYGRARRVGQQEEIMILNALERQRAKVAKNEIAELRARLEALESKLRMQDEEFHSEDIRALRQGLGVAR